MEGKNNNKKPKPQTQKGTDKKIKNTPSLPQSPPPKEKINKMLTTYSFVMHAYQLPDNCIFSVFLSLHNCIIEWKSQASTRCSVMLLYVYANTKKPYTTCVLKYFKV